MADQHTATTRLSMCRDILGLRTRISTASPEHRTHARVLGVRRIASIRRVLLGRPDKDLVDDLMSPVVGYSALDAIMQSIEDEPEVVRVRSALYVSELIKMYRSITAAEHKAGLLDSNPDIPEHLFDKVFKTIGTASIEHADEIADAAIDAGKFNDDMRSMASSAVAAHDKAKEEIKNLNIADVDPELHEQIKAIEAENDAIYKIHWDLDNAYYSLRSEIINGMWNGREQEADAEIKRLREQKSKAWDDYNNHRDQKLNPIRAKSREALAKAREKMDEPFADVGRKAFESVMATSEVDQQQADAWASGQEITKAAAARLKKLGYPIEQVRQDMAEFYRFTGGRVTTVKIDSKGDRRANATQINSHGHLGAINLGSAFDKRVLWHELAHHIESDPVARMAAGRLVKRRSVDGEIHKLRSITGNKGYDNKEVAYKDHFFDAYVGKVYRDGMTEVFSMGVESFSNPVTLGKRIAADPQTLEFVAGYLKQPMEPLAKAFVKMRDTMREVNEESRQVRQEAAVDLVKELANSVTMTEDSDSDWVKEKGLDYYIKGKQVGFFYDSTNGTNWYVFSTQVRNRETGRKMLGYGVYSLQPRGELNAQGKPRYALELREYATKDLDVVKAAFGIFRKTGDFPAMGELNNGDFLRKQVSQ